MKTLVNFMFLCAGLMLNNSNSFAADVAPSYVVPENLACFFTGTNFQGPKFCYYPGQKPPNLIGVRLSDGSASDGHFLSIEIIGIAYANIYEHQDMNAYAPGHQRQVTTSITDLMAAGWPYLISSVDVEMDPSLAAQ